MTEDLTEQVIQLSLKFHDQLHVIFLWK